MDGEDAFVTAVNHLVSLGHDRVAFVGAPVQHQFAQDRLNGYQSAITGNGLTLDQDLIQIAEFSDDSAEIATTVAQPQAHAGRRLGDMLFAIIDGDDPSNHQELQRAYLVRRKTDGPLRKAVVGEDVLFREEHT